VLSFSSAPHFVQFIIAIRQSLFQKNGHDGQLVTVDFDRAYDGLTLQRSAAKMVSSQSEGNIDPEDRAVLQHVPHVGIRQTGFLEAFIRMVCGYDPPTLPKLPNPFVNVIPGLAD
jgi:hypothetical protein